ncbi:MAG TPA: heme-copper oxidase subunit III [Opitutaceae bacterium]|nr:heme-copper oxidase subunit III [Opitutaceae bacterium]
MSNAATGAIDHHFDPTTSTGIPNKKLLMWMFLASDCMFFGCLISTHLIYRLHPPPGTPSAKSVFSIELTSFSTFILLMSSLMMALAVNSIQKGNLKTLRSSLLTTILFGSIFLGCQVFEFNNFVFEKHLTITNSILGTTFFTLTGTHGCHVAVGVFWLTLMYVRSFQPKDTTADRSWFVRNLVHIVACLGTILLGMMLVLKLVRSLQGAPSFGAGVGLWLKDYWIALIGIAVTGTLMRILARPSGAVAFDEHNAIDVEMMGLYWHFVDIVWIVIFTAVYLLEYI